MVVVAEMPEHVELELVVVDVLVEFFTGFMVVWGLSVRVVASLVSDCRLIQVSRCYDDVSGTYMVIRCWSRSDPWLGSAALSSSSLVRVWYRWE